MVTIAIVATFLSSLRRPVTLRFLPEIGRIYDYRVELKSWSDSELRAIQPMLQKLFPNARNESFQSLREGLEDRFQVELRMFVFSRTDEGSLLSFLVDRIENQRIELRIRSTHTPPYNYPQLRCLVDSHYRTIALVDGASPGGYFANSTPTILEGPLSPGQSWTTLMPVGGISLDLLPMRSHAYSVPMSCAYEGIFRGYARINTQVSDVTLVGDVDGREVRIRWKGTYLVDLKTGVFVKGYTTMNLKEVEGNRSREHTIVQTLELVRS